MAEQPAADRAHDEPEREQDGGVQLLDDRVVAGKERAREVQREGRVGIEVVPLDEIADRADENRGDAPANVGELQGVLPAEGRGHGNYCYLKCRPRPRTALGRGMKPWHPTQQAVSWSGCAAIGCVLCETAKLGTFSDSI